MLERGIAKALLERVAAGEKLIFETLGHQPVVNPAAADNVLARTLVLAPAKVATKRLVVFFNGNVGTSGRVKQLWGYPKLHVISIRDPERCFCLTGIKGLASSLEGCIDGIRQLAGRLGAEEIYCFGGSAGGYPALRYSWELNARGVLLFSPPTTLDLADDPGAPMSKYPELARLYARARGLATDLVAPYSRLKRRPSVLLVYSRLHPRDSWLAERMRGVPGVEMTPLEFAEHKTLMHAAQNRQLRGYLDRLFAMEPYVAP